MATQTSPPEEPHTEGPKHDPATEARSNFRELTIMEHLRELRYRVTVMAIAVVVGMAVSLFLAPEIIRFLLRPARESIPDFELIFTEPLGYVGSYFRVALLSGITFAMPVIVYQSLLFVLPALTPQEKRWILPIVLGASLSFLAGCAFAFYIVMPPGMKFLLTFGEGVATPFIRIDSYINFVTRMLLAVGLSFETPLIVMALARFRIVTARRLLGYWRYAVVLAFVAAAILTPSIDPVTQSLVAGPIIVLYAVGIILAFIVERR